MDFSNISNILSILSVLVSLLGVGYAGIKWFPTTNIRITNLEKGQEELKSEIKDLRNDIKGLYTLIVSQGNQNMMMSQMERLLDKKNENK